LASSSALRLSSSKRRRSSSTRRRTSSSIWRLRCAAVAASVPSFWNETYFTITPAPSPPPMNEAKNAARKICPVRGPVLILVPPEWR
jgi:hypothetical protein